MFHRRPTPRGARRMGSPDGPRIGLLNQVPLTDGNGNASAITLNGPLLLPANITVEVLAGILGVNALVTVRSNGVVVQSGLLSGLINLVGSLTGLQLNLGSGVVILQTYTLVLP